MDDEVASSLVESPAVHGQELPPLRIHHLMMWMAVTAILISLVLWFDRTARNGPPIADKVVIAALVVLAIAVSGALTAVGFGWSWRMRGYRFPAAPGERLLFDIAIAVVGVVLWIASVFVVFFIEEDFVGVYSALFIFCACVALLVHNIKIAFRHAGTHAWQVVFYCVAAGYLIVPFSAASGAYFVVALVGASAAALIVWAVYEDRRRQLSRGWLHWWGVLAAVLVCLSMTAAFSSF